MRRKGYLYVMTRRGYKQAVNICKDCNVIALQHLWTTQTGAEVLKIMARADMKWNNII